MTTEDNEEADYLWDALAMRAPVAFRPQVPDNYIPCRECARKGDEVNVPSVSGTHMTTTVFLAAAFLVVAAAAFIAGALMVLRWRKP